MCHRGSKVSWFLHWSKNVSTPVKWAGLQAGVKGYQEKPVKFRRTSHSTVETLFCVYRTGGKCMLCFPSLLGQFLWCEYVCAILMELWITGSTIGDVDTQVDTLKSQSAACSRSIFNLIKLPDSFRSYLRSPGQNRKLLKSVLQWLELPGELTSGKPDLPEFHADEVKILLTLKPHTRTRTRWWGQLQLGYVMEVTSFGSTHKYTQLM